MKGLTQNKLKLDVAEFYMLAGSFFNIWLMDLCFQFRNNANRAS